MSQMFHMLQDMDKNGRTFNEVLQHNGYEYQWRMLENELYAQMKMAAHGDHENAGARNRWFGGFVASDMALRTTSVSSVSTWMTTSSTKSRKTRTEM